jgi:Rieske Fe-S protein
LITGGSRAGGGPESAGGVARRKFLGQGLGVVILSLGRRVWVQGFQLRYQPLARPVAVPLANLATPGRAFPFVAEGVTLASAAIPNQPIRITGMVVRTAAGDDQPERFKAVCVKCPHEGCDVDFVAEPSRLPPEIVNEIGHRVTEPVYVCPCHFSTFKADAGERLAGPAARGLYRFRVTGVNATFVEIAEVEEDVLLFG